MHIAARPVLRGARVQQRLEQGQRGRDGEARRGARGGAAHARRARGEQRDARGAEGHGGGLAGQVARQRRRQHGAEGYKSGGPPAVKVALRRAAATSSAGAGPERWPVCVRRNPGTRPSRSLAARRGSGCLGKLRELASGQRV
jgi:hypothetical protein